MNAHDRMPETRADQPFPIGDVERTQLADEWIAMMEGDDWEELMSYVDATYKPFNQPYLANVNHLMTEELCKQWDRLSGARERYAAIGFKIANSFVYETGLLPEADGELRMAIIRMKHETSAADFARNAWSGMAKSHPRLFAYHESLFHFAQDELELNDPDNAANFIAGLSLPYILSQAAVLANEATEFTSMTDEKLNLQTTPFSEFFSDKVPLVSNRPEKRKISP